MFLWLRNNSTCCLAALLTLMLAAGCATQRSAKKGDDAAKHSNWDAAVYYYLEALAGDPDNVEYRMGLVRAKQKAAQEHFKRATVLRDLGRLTSARDELEMAVQLDPTHQFAEQELKQVRRDLEILMQPEGEKTLEEMKRRAREAKVQPPTLDPTSKEPITLKFPKPKPVKEIYQAIGKAYGFNVIFDAKLKDDKLAIELNDVTAERALELVMQQANHFYKVLDSRSIMIAEDTPQNRREYEDLVIKTFFLSNAEVKEVDKLLRSLIEARRLATNDQLNAITLRDTADKVAIAEKLISVNDKAKAEVLVDVELLQIDTTGNRSLGMTIDTYSFFLNIDQSLVTDNPAPDISQTPGYYLDDLSNISRSAWYINVPNVLINLVKSSSEAQTLAQPQVRITEGEKAALVIGDRVPIPVTSFNQGNIGGGGVVPITSFQYQDVGIKIDVEPRVHHNREVTLKLSVEVSQLGNTVEFGQGQSAIQIGTRTINSVIRLKDGETSLLAGLIRVDKSASESKTPLLGEIPVLGRLFTNKTTQSKTSELVLTLTPHIIRFPDIAEEDLAPVWVGTESRISFGNRPLVQSGRTDRGPFDRRSDDDNGRTRTLPRRPIPRPQTSESSRTTPVQQVQPPRELVPSPIHKSGDDDEETEVYDDVDKAAASAINQGADLTKPLAMEATDHVVVSLEPSVVTLSPGQTTSLQVIATGGWGGCRLPIGLTYNPERLAVRNVVPTTGTMLLDKTADEQEGWLGLELVVADYTGLPQLLATVEVEALKPGPVPMVLVVEPAVGEDGAQIPVSASDAAVFVHEAGTQFTEE